MIYFQTLWDNYPNRYQDHCKADYTQNECAVRMGIALEKSSIDLLTFPGVRCWSGHNPRHILRAQELADWINENDMYFGKKEVCKKQTTGSDYRAMKGIVFIKDGWYGGVDHIDLWNGSYMKGGDAYYFELAKEVWFWTLI